MNKPLADHGTLSRYKHHGCRCKPCCDNLRAYENRRYRLRGYGTWQPLVDVQPVREHVSRMVSDGYTIASIAKTAGTDVAALSRILYGPSKKLRTETAQRLLSVDPGDLTKSEHRTIDATGTRRRLHALVAIGWPLSHISRHIGVHPRRVVEFSNANRVALASARRVEAGYRRLCGMDPANYGVPQGHITAARRLAAVRGWHGPLAWDADTIDDPAATPETDTDAAPAESRFTRADAQHVAAEIRHLAAFGVPAHEIAARVQRSETYIRDQLRGARGPGWRQQIGEAA